MNNIQIQTKSGQILSFNPIIKDDKLILLLNDNLIISKEDTSLEKRIEVQLNTVKPMEPKDIKNMSKQVMQFFQKDDKCPNDECKALKKKYLQELAALNAHYQQFGGCPSCKKGALMRKYIPLATKFYEEKIN